MLYSTDENWDPSKQKALVILLIWTFIPKIPKHLLIF